MVYAEGVAKQEEYLRVMVKFLVVLDLLGRKVGKILVAQAADEECAVDNIVVTQHAVQRQTQRDTVIVADDTGPVSLGIDSLNRAANDLLLSL